MSGNGRADSPAERLRASPALADSGAESRATHPQLARPETGSLSHALELCLRHLNRCDHTTAQLRARLGRARFESEVVEQALAELHAARYLDDRRYAQRFAEDRRRLDGWGNERIRVRLEAAGVERELIDAALAERGGADELEAAIDLLRVRFAAPPGDDRARNRALGLLVRRGYESELAYEAIRRYGSEAA